MLTDEHAVGEARGYRVRGRVRQTKRRRVSAQGIVGGDGFRHRSGLCGSTPIIDVLPVIAVRPAIDAHRRHVVRDQVVTDLIAFVDRYPQRARVRLPRHANRIAQAGRKCPMSACSQIHLPDLRTALSSSMPCSATLLFEPLAMYIFDPSALAMMFFVQWCLRNPAGRSNNFAGAAWMAVAPASYEKRTIASVFATYRASPTNAMPKGEFSPDRNAADLRFAVSPSASRRSVMRFALGTPPPAFF